MSCTIRAFGGKANLNFIIFLTRKYGKKYAEKSVMWSAQMRFCVWMTCVGTHQGQNSCAKISITAEDPAHTTTLAFEKHSEGRKIPLRTSSKPICSLCMPITSNPTNSLWNPGNLLYWDKMACSMFNCSIPRKFQATSNTREHWEYPLHLEREQRNRSRRAWENTNPHSRMQALCVSQNVLLFSCFLDIEL